MGSKVNREMDKKLFNFLDKKKVATKEEIIDKIGCNGALMAVILKRGQEPYLTSYNHNRKYYALVKNLDFDENGCYFVGKAGFVKQGTMKKMILHKINNSNSGVRSLEIENILGKNGRDVLARLHVADKVLSQRFGNIRYYFNADQNVRISQIAERNKIYEEEFKNAKEIDHEIILSIIGVCLRTSNLPVKKIFQKLKRMGFSISLDEVKEVIKTYKLNDTNYTQKKNFG